MLQTILVIAIVGACLAVVLRQAFASLRGKPSRLGSCCAKGCQPNGPAKSTNPTSQRIVFLPVEMLSRKR